MNNNNEQIKRKFQTYLQDAQGMAETTIDKYLRALELFEKATNYKDYKRCTTQQIIGFKKTLRDRSTNGNPISLVTIRSYLIYLQKFFKWLIDQPGYRTLKSQNIVEYLKPNRKENKIAASSGRKDFPNLEYVQQLCSSIKIDDCYARRDRALIAFTFMSGARIDSIISLSISCFNPETLRIDMDPKNGVKTKFSKYIPGKLFEFDKDLLKYVLDWYSYLLKIGFTPKDPLFPKTKMIATEDKYSFSKSDQLSKEYWESTAGARNIFSARAKDANLKKYAPHNYRHGFILHVLPFVTSGDQLKALSQTFGHESVKTTLQHYGNFSDEERLKTLASIEFLASSTLSEHEKLFMEFTEFLRQKKENKDAR